MDEPTDPNNVHFRDLLDAMGLVQHVKQPSHIHGHALDLIITRQSDDFVAEEPLSERFISDRAAVTGLISLIYEKYYKLMEVLYILPMIFKVKPIFNPI